jgi:hypothetical protein
MKRLLLNALKSVSDRIPRPPEVEYDLERNPDGPMPLFVSRKDGSKWYYGGNGKMKPYVPGEPQDTRVVSTTVREGDPESARVYAPDR